MSEAERSFNCPHCQRQYKWRSALAGKKVKCKCGQVLTIPGSPASPDALPSAPATAPVAPSQPVVAAPVVSPPTPPPPAADPDDPLAALASASAQEAYEHPETYQRVVRHTHYESEDIHALQRVNAGFGMMIVVGIIAVMLWLGLLVAVALIIAGAMAASKGMLATGGMLMLILIFGGGAVGVAWLVGVIMLLTAPRAAEIRGLMVAALVIPFIAIAFSIGLAVLLHVLKAGTAVDAAGIPGILGMGVAMLCFMTYHTRLAKYIEKHRIAGRFGVLIVFMIVILVIQLISAACKIGAAGEMSAEEFFEKGGSQAMFLGMPAMTAMHNLTAGLASLLSMFATLWYVLLLFGFRKAIKKVVAKASSCPNCGTYLRHVQEPVCPNCGTPRTDTFAPQVQT